MSILRSVTVLAVALSLTLVLVAGFIASSFLDWPTLKFLFTNSFLFITALCLGLVYTGAEVVQIASMTTVCPVVHVCFGWSHRSAFIVCALLQVADRVFFTAIMSAQVSIAWLTLCIDALPLDASKRWAVRTWLAFTLVGACAQLAANSHATSPFNTAVTLSPTWRDITMNIRQAALLGIAWLTLRSLVMFWTTPYACQYLQGALELNLFEMPDENSYVSSVQTDAINKLQAMQAELSVAEQLPPGHWWLTSMYPIEYAMPARSRPLLPNILLRSLWARPWFIWFIGAWLGLMIAWLWLVADTPSQILMAVVFIPLFCCLVHMVDGNVLIILATRLGHAFTYWSVTLATTCLFMLQAREYLFNTVQMNLYASSSHWSMSQKTGTRIFNSAVLWVMAVILANSIDAVSPAAPRWGKIICLGAYCILHLINLYYYTFRWDMAHSPQGCVGLPHGSTCRYGLCGGNGVCVAIVPFISIFLSFLSGAQQHDHAHHVQLDRAGVLRQVLADHAALPRPPANRFVFHCARHRRRRGRRR